MNDIQMELAETMIVLEECQAKSKRTAKRLETSNNAVLFILSNCFLGPPFLGGTSLHYFTLHKLKYFCKCCSQNKGSTTS